jgi:hypothetical protein
MMQQFRICPTNKLLIEWKLSGDHWGFYRICDSPNDAKRSLSVIQETQRRIVNKWNHLTYGSNPMVMTDQYRATIRTALEYMKDDSRNLRIQLDSQSYDRTLADIDAALAYVDTLAALDVMPQDVPQALRDGDLDNDDLHALVEVLRDWIDKLENELISVLQVAIERGKYLGKNGDEAYQKRINELMGEGAEENG